MQATKDTPLLKQESNEVKSRDDLQSYIADAKSREISWAEE